jgi:hypothetical protein
VCFVVGCFGGCEDKRFEQIIWSANGRWMKKIERWMRSSFVIIAEICVPTFLVYEALRLQGMYAQSEF